MSRRWDRSAAGHQMRDSSTLDQRRLKIYPDVSSPSQSCGRHPASTTAGALLPAPAFLAPPPPPALTPGQKHLVQVLLPHGPSQWSKAEMSGMPLILLTLHSPSEREFSSPWSLHQTGTRTSTHCCMRTPSAFPFCVPSFAYTQP